MSDQRREAGERPPSALRSVETDAVLSVSDEGRVETWNDRCARTFGVRAAAAVGEPFRALFADPDRATALLRAARRDGRIETEARRRGEEWLRIAVVAAPEGFVVVASAGRADREGGDGRRDVRRRIEALVRRVLVATAPETVDRTLAAGLTALFGADAWVADRDPDLSLRAGEETPAYRDALAASSLPGTARAAPGAGAEADGTDSHPDGSHPAGPESEPDSPSSGDVDPDGADSDDPGHPDPVRFVSDGVDDDPRIPERLRRAAARRGYRSLALLRLTDGRTDHGLLAVHAERSGAFGAAERAALATLAVAAGTALEASRRRRLLLSDRVVELELALADPAGRADAAFAALAARCGPCRLEDVVPGFEAAPLQFLAVEADPATVRAAAERVDAVEDHRFPGDGGPDGAGDRTDDTGEDAPDASGPDVPRDDDTAARPVDGETAPPSAAPTRVEVWTGPEELLDRLIDAGAVVREAVGGPDGCRVTLETTADATPDLSALLERRFPAWRLAGKRPADRPEPAAAAADAIEALLTDKQLAALRTAYRAGYFDNPRGSTAQQVAADLDISDTTLFQHLQVAQRKLVERTLYRRDDP